MDCSRSARTTTAFNNHIGKLRGVLALAAVTCALMLVADPLRAATPGLPFNEDFADDGLIDAAGTTAAWVASKQAMQLIERSTWNQPIRNRAFFPPLNEVNSLPMNIEIAPTTDVALGDVNHDGNLDMVVVNESFSGTDYPNRICLGDGTGAMAGNGSNCRTYDDSAGFDHRTNAVLLVDVDHDGNLDIIEGRDGGQNRLNLGHGDGTFAGGTSIGDETDSTWDLRVADLDRDGNLDLVVANRGDTNKVYFGDGSGGFSATGTDIGSETELTVSIALGDLDRDGDIDVVASSGSVKRIYLNDGSGGFGASGTEIGLDSDSDRTASLALADFTSDGVQDLVLVNGDTSSQKIYPGDGNGGFTNTGLSFAGSGSSSVGIDDFNGDGHLDIVFGGGSAEGMHLGDGAGGFSSKGSTLDRVLNDTVSLAVGDIDNDGSPDVVLPQGLFGSSLPNHVYLNSPGTGFDPQGLDLIPSFETTTNALKLADVDGDGDLDVVTGRLGASDAVYINQFDGEFDLPGANAAFFDGPETIASSGTQTAALNLGDLDGDGILDLVTTDKNGPKKLFFGNGTGGFVYQGDFGTADFGSAESIGFGDVDGDGDLDILVPYQGGSGIINRFYLNDGAGGFPATGTSIGDESEDSFAIAFGDVDGDGNPDIVVGNDGSAPNRLHLGNGDGGFSASGTAIGTTNYNTRAIELVDFDGDGDLDVIAGNRNQTDRVYLNDGSGDFPGNGNALSSRNANTVELLIDDVNNDAVLDIIALESATTVLYLGDGDGGVGRTVSFGVDGITSGGVGALGDLDRDGDLDLVTGAFSEQDYIYFNEFDGGSFDALTLPAGSGSNASRSAVWINANGDHWPDLAVANDGDVNRLYPGTADGPSGSGSAIGFESDSSQAFAQADFNHDGAMDLVVANVGDQNRLYLGDGNGGFSGSGIAVGLGVDNSRSIAVGDIDRDGHPDVVVGNDGQPNRFYLGDGTGDFSETGSAIGIEIDATWSIALADIDLDGWLDVVAGNAGQANRLYTGDGAGDFNNGAAIGAESDTTRGVAVADLDDDGKPDVVTANDGQPNRYYLGDGAGGFHAGVDLGLESEASQSIALADIGNDGDYDVIVGNLGEANRLYLDNGALDFGSVTFDAVAGANQTRGVLAGDSDRDGNVDVFSFNDSQVNRQLVQSGYLAHANVVTSEKINDTETGITELRLTATVFGLHENRYYLSNDDGGTWHRVESGVDFTFPSPGDDVRWRAELVGENRVMPPSLLAMEIAVPAASSSGDDTGSDNDSGSGSDSGSSGGGGGGGSVSPWLLLGLWAAARCLRRHRPGDIGTESG